MVASYSKSEMVKPGMGSEARKVMRRHLWLTVNLVAILHDKEGIIVEVAEELDVGP
jgi:hypothetical protein